jgi:DNA-binding transcriptional ArsR family regulator
VHDLEVIDDPAAAAAALDPIKSRLLSELTLPASAANLAERVGLTRQKVNYHLRSLETHGLVRVAEERRWGGLTEHLFVATAGAYVISPGALGPAAVDPGRTTDRLSASYLVALAARAVREVGGSLRRALASEKRVATLALDAEIRFASAAERAAFTADLNRAITALVARYHDGSAPGGRAHRLLVMAHPKPTAGNPERSQHVNQD